MSSRHTKETERKIHWYNDKGAFTKFEEANVNAEYDSDKRQDTGEYKRVS